MKGIAKLVLVLALVCVAAALGLSVVEQMTREPIAQALRKELLDAVEAVLPAFDNAPDEDKVTIEEREYYVGTKDGIPVGAAFKVSSMEGYSGLITALVGVNPGGVVTGVSILIHTETPGLGAKITAPAFLAQFKDKELSTAQWLVKKDGGDFDQITGATVSPRALVAAIDSGLKAFMAEKAKVFAAKEGAK